SVSNHVVDHAECSLRLRDARCRLLGLAGRVAMQSESLHDRRERQTLSDKRHEYHEEGDEDYEIACGDGHARVGVEWNRQSDHERVSTAHAGPGNECAFIPRWL